MIIKNTKKYLILRVLRTSMYTTSMTKKKRHHPIRICVCIRMTKHESHTHIKSERARREDDKAHSLLTLKTAMPN